MSKAFADFLKLIRDDLEDALVEAQTAVDETDTLQSREVYGFVDEALHAVENALREG